MPRQLAPSDVEEFRERLCVAAEGLFAEHGLEGMSMRQLAESLHVSPMTPYRYFKNKDEILTMVRTRGFERFAQALETARDNAPATPAGRAAAVSDAYLTFAFADTNAYRLMFDFYQPNEFDNPALAAAVDRASKTRVLYTSDLGQGPHSARDRRFLEGATWVTIHGAIVLELAHKLPPGTARRMSDRFLQIFLGGGAGLHQRSLTV